jgi:hypothetical protein
MIRGEGHDQKEEDQYNRATSPSAHVERSRVHALAWLMVDHLHDEHDVMCARLKEEMDWLWHQNVA